MIADLVLSEFDAGNSQIVIAQRLQVN